RSHLMECVRQQVSEGVGVIYASHYMEEVQSICHRVAIIDHGEVLANDTIPHLLSGLSADLYLYVERTTGLARELKDFASVEAGNDGEPIVIIPGDVPTEQKREISSQKTRIDTPKDSDGSHECLAWRLQAVLSKLETLGVRVLRVETQQSNLERLF